MTLQQIIDRCSYLLRYDMDNNYASSLGAPSTAESVALYNEAQKNVARRSRCLFDPAITFDITQDTYAYSLGGAQFGRDVDKVFRVRINGVYLRTADGGSYGLWTMEEVATELPGWLEATADTPVRAWQFGDRLYINPKPSATAAAYTCYVEGTYNPADLTTGDLSDTCELPEELHAAVAYEMALLSSTPSLTEGHQSARCAIWKAACDDLEKPYQEEMASYLSGFGTLGTRRPSDVIYI